MPNCCSHKSLVHCADSNKDQTDQYAAGAAEARDAASNVTHCHNSTVDFNATFLLATWWQGDPEMQHPLTNAFQLAASHGRVHGPVDELVVGPVIDRLQPSCQCTPEGLCNSRSSRRKSLVDDAVMLPHDAIAHFAEDLEGLQHAALGLQSRPRSIDTQPSSLIHRKPIQMTHVHLGDAVPRCRRLPTKPWREAMYGLVGDFPFGPDVWPRTETDLRERCSRCAEGVGSAEGGRGGVTMPSELV